MHSKNGSNQRNVFALQRTFTLTSDGCEDDMEGLYDDISLESTPGGRGSSVVLSFSAGKGIPVSDGNGGVRDFTIQKTNNFDSFFYSN